MADNVHITLRSCLEHRKSVHKETRQTTDVVSETDTTASADMQLYIYIKYIHIYYAVHLNYNKCTLIISVIKIQIDKPIRKNKPKQTKYCSQILWSGVL